MCQIICYSEHLRVTRRLSWAYMLQDCLLPIQSTWESFRMFLAYPHTRPRLMARVITPAMFTSSLCYASHHHDVMSHVIMMLCIISCIYGTHAASSSSHCLMSLYFFFFFFFFVIITYSLPYHDSYRRSDVTRPGSASTNPCGSTTWRRLQSRDFQHLCIQRCMQSWTMSSFCQ
jgi:hypothetical protein